MNDLLDSILETRTKTVWPYRVDIDTTIGQKAVDAWCEKHCKGKFTSIQLGNRVIIYRFKNQNDMTLFILRWGTIN